MQNSNRRILVNTGVMYGQLIINAVIGLVTSRFILQALGASDFGLYSVVGGLIAMLNVICIAMHTTTRRFINVEMGKLNGNLNRIFNISRLIHIGFALFLFLLAETIGLFYIYNYLNVAPEKLDDAIFVFHVSTFSAALSIVNIPYQALITAYEKFVQSVAIELIGTLLKLIFVLYLIHYEGNPLRLFSIGVSGLTLISLSLNNLACYLQWHKVVAYKFYKGWKQYKEILSFNNYVALGAFSSIGRIQGTALLVNFFFGTLVNAAFAIGNTVESYCNLLVSRIGTAAAPQIAQNYADNNNRSLFLTETINKIAIFLMLAAVVPLSMELEFILQIWLKNVPEGAALVCHLTLISALVRVITGGTSDLVQASGKIKWFQITSSIIELLSLPISYVLFRTGLPATIIIIVFIISSIVNRIVSFYLMHRILSFNVRHYAQNVYSRSFGVIIVLTGMVLGYRMLPITTTMGHVVGLISGFIVTVLAVYAIGLKNDERKRVFGFISSRLNHRNK